MRGGRDASEPVAVGVAGEAAGGVRQRFIIEDRMLIGGATTSPGTSLAPPSRRTRFTLRSWNASSSARWPTLMIAVFGSCSAELVHQHRLALGIERRGRLVHHDDVGLVQEQPREGEALLLAAGQRAVPWHVLVVELLDEMPEADHLQRLVRAPCRRCLSAACG